MNQSVSQRFNILCIKFKMRVFAITALVAVICEGLHDSLISHKISSTPPLLIEVSVPSRQSEQSFICVLGVLIFP